MPEFGLPDTTLALIRQILADHHAVQTAILYGSRAKGNYGHGSDIDLTLTGEVLDDHLLGKIAGQLEESPIPYQVDLSRLDRINNPNLREHIERVGVLFYERGDKRKTTDPLVKKATAILRQGGLVAFPTETVYGLGARVFDDQAIARIFSVKGRPSDNPIIIHIAEREQLQLLSPELPPVVDDLIKAFWPGPLTLVLKRLASVPAIVSAGLATIAVRLPNHPMALALIRELNEPIAAPSANRSGRPSPTSANHVREELGAAIDFILDGGPCTVGLESTVLDVISSPPRILRPGAITEEALRSVIGKVIPYAEENPSVSSPGQKHAHYAPNLKIVLVASHQWQVILEESAHNEKRIGTISLQPASLLYSRVMADLADYAQNLFAAFYEAEAAGVDILFVEKVHKEGLGVAIMDRLERAAAANKSFSLSSGE